MTDQENNPEPAFEPFTCATDHLAAERALRIVEAATRLGEVMTENDIYAVKSLCDKAGVQFARHALEGGGVPF